MNPCLSTIDQLRALVAQGREAIGYPDADLVIWLNPNVLAGWATCDGIPIERDATIPVETCYIWPRHAGRPRPDPRNKIGSRRVRLPPKAAGH